MIRIFAADESSIGLEIVDGELRIQMNHSADPIDREVWHFSGNETDQILAHLQRRRNKAKRAVGGYWTTEPRERSEQGEGG